MRVLDEMETPGVLELVAYCEQEANWVVIARKGGGLFVGIALGTGSHERQIETSSVIDPSFAVAFARYCAWDRARRGLERGSQDRDEECRFGCRDGATSQREM